MPVVMEIRLVVETISRCIVEIKRSVSSITVNRTNFLMLAYYVAEMRPLIDELNKHDNGDGDEEGEGEGFLNSHPAWPALHRLGHTMEAIDAFVTQCSSQSRIFLLYRSSSVVQKANMHIADLTQNLHSMLSRDMQPPERIREELLKYLRKLESAIFYEDPEHARMGREISSSLFAGHFDQVHSTKLLEKVVAHLNVFDSEASKLKTELKTDLELAETQNRQADARDLRSLLALFQPALISSERRNFGSMDSPLNYKGITPIPNSFFCPITGQIMNEPVMLEDGHSYERSAIKEWFDRGHNTSPVSQGVLDSLDLAANLKLQQAIHEFFENRHREKVMHAISIVRDQENSTDVDEAINLITKLTDSESKFRRLLVSLDGVQPLVAILRPSEFLVREKIFRILYNVAALGEEYKICVIKAEAVPILLRILGKNPGGNGGPVQLLWELSKCEEGIKAILAEKGSVLIIASAYKQCTSDQKLLAEKLLDSLCDSDSKAIMDAARASIFGPLIHHLTSGEERAKLELASAIYDDTLELNEHGIVSLVGAGVLLPLLDLLQKTPIECKQVAANALCHLSSVDANKAAFAGGGAIPALVKSLNIPITQLRVNILSALYNLAPEVTNEAAVTPLLNVMESKNEVVRESALKTLERIAKYSHSVRASLMELEVVPKIYVFLQDGFSPSCHKYALSLLSHFADDMGTRQAIATSGEYLHILMHLLADGSVSFEERESIFTILAGLSRLDEMKDFLVSESKLLLSLSHATVKERSPKIQEHAAFLLSMLTDPALSDMKNLVSLSKQGLLSDLLDMITEVSSTDSAKGYAAIALSHFASQTPLLTLQLPLFKRVLARMGFKKYRACKVHGGKCSLKETFCLLEAMAVPSLISLVKNGGPQCAEQAVEVLFTLVKAEKGFERGVDVLVKNEIIPAVVSLMGRNESSTEKAAKLLQVVFRVRKYRDVKYSRIAKASLCTTMMSGNAKARKEAATALMHLGLVAANSTYSTQVETAQQ